MVFTTTITFKYIFDYRDQDTYFGVPPISAGSPGTAISCTVPWQPGPSGSCSKACRPTRMSIGSGTYGEVQGDHFYTAPTAIRAVMREGENPVQGTSPRACGCWEPWASRSTPRFGSGTTTTRPRAGYPVVDTWWQTETGGILITPLPGAHTLKPGSTARPFFGVEPIILDEGNSKLKWRGAARTTLVARRPWPGIMRTVYGDHGVSTRPTSRLKGMYFTGDGSRSDEDGYFWITGRLDDVINVSGHRMGTAEVESALVSTPGGRGRGRRLSARDQGRASTPM